MATNWDPSRDYDSETFSEDYNQHGASARSLDHPSITRDDNFFKALHLTDDNDDNNGGRYDDDDDDSIDNADLDMIADIVDNRAPASLRNQTGPLREALTQADENSESSIMRYLIHGSQDPLEYRESLDFVPARYQPDQEEPLVDNAIDDHFRERSGSTPKRRSLDRSALKASPMPKRTMIPTKQQSVEQARRVRGVPIEDGFKPTAMKSGIPRKGTGAAIPSPKRLLGEKIIVRNNNNNNVPAETPPKPVFRSAMKATNYTNNNSKSNNDGSSSNIQPSKSKLGRHIQLPTEILDDDEESEQAPEMNHGPKDNDPPEMARDDQVAAERVEQTEQQVEEEEQEQEQEPVDDAIDDVVTASTTPTVPGPSRFTRISKKTLSPARKLIATIPTPQDDGTEQVQKNVKELKAILRRLGLLPLSASLESSMNGLDAATVEKGGLCETLILLQKLAGTCEKQKEVIDQMTDQIIASETQPRREDPGMEEKIQRMADELEEVKAELNEANKRNRALESRSTEATMELERLRLNKETSVQASATETKVKFLDATTEISGNWGSIEELLDQRGEGSRIPRSKKAAGQNQRLQFEEVPAKWRGHIQKIEQELHALKAMLDRHSSSSPSGATTSEVDELEDILNEVLLDNRRLKQKNKSLTRELLSLHEEVADQDLKGRVSKYKMLLKDVMVRLGVENHKQIPPALNEIERIVRDLPNLRQFIAKAEKIIWESEIVEGTVKVQKYSRGIIDGPESLDNDSKGPVRKSTGESGSSESGGAGLVIWVGRTCSRSFEETLQRLQEWSELLDVLNHVEFADNSDDTSVAPMS